MNPAMTDPNEQRMMSLSFLKPLGMLLIAPALLSYCASQVEAAITPTGDVTPVYTGADPWEVGGSLVVGYNADGTFYMDEASVVDTGSGAAVLGLVSNVTGTATVSGQATFLDAYVLRVGESGTGILNIEHAGEVNSSFAYIGMSSGSNGTVNITGPDSYWWNRYTVEVGVWGTGTLNIENGGRQSQTNIRFGLRAGSQGSATITGTDSFGGFYNLIVGDHGEGSINILDGGQVNSTSVHLGFYDDSSGVVTVSGLASTWNVSGNLRIGEYGLGEMTIADGGVVTSAQNYIGALTGSHGEVTITGAGSTWNTTSWLYVGFYGEGSLTVEDGGVVNTYTSSIVRNSGIVTIDGVGSVWKIDNALAIGSSGTGTLNISNGGLVNVSGQADIGPGGVINFDNGTLNTGRLMVPDSVLLGTGTVNTKSLIADFDLVFDASTGHQAQTVISNFPDQHITLNIDASNAEDTGPMGAGRIGTGSLTIADGLSLTYSEGFLGHDAASVGSALVTGSGSAWNSINELYVGHSGSGTLRVDNGGLVTNATGYIGYDSGSVGAAIVDGAGSAWLNNGDLTIGQSGLGTLRIQNGAVVTNNNGYLGTDTEANGSVVVSGAGSTWNNSGQIHIENTSTLQIESGGSVISSGGSISNNLGSDSTASVGGIDSHWDVAGTLVVGGQGTGTLTVHSGGSASSTNAYLGKEAGSSGLATISGAYSTWNNSNNLFVGFEGSGSLEIYNEGHVSVAGRTVVGAGSTITFNDGTLDTGALEATNDALLGQGTINTKAMIADADLVFNQATGLQTQFVINNIPGQNITVHLDAVAPVSNSKIGVGNTGTGTLSVSDGLTLSYYEGFLGYEPGSSGSATVTGTGTTWNNSGDLRVGYYGQGSLTIEDGGTVNNATGSIGYYPGSSGTVIVSGAGSSWYNSGRLIVGNYGDGMLRIEEGGSVEVIYNLTMGYPHPLAGSGTVDLMGGTLDLHGSDIIQRSDASVFNFTGGTLRGVRRLSLNHAFTQSGGVLAPGDSIGTTIIYQDYILSAGSIELEWGGIGYTYDQVIATGNIHIALAGTTLDLLPFGPMAAGTYTVLVSTEGSLTGTFEHITGIVEYAGLVDVTYTANAVQITLNRDFVPGDLNADGFVGLDDLDIVITHWNQTVPVADLTQGDYSRDGYVGLDDLDAVLQNWNQGAPPSGITQNIPEPSMFVLLAFGAIGGTYRLSSRCAARG